LIKIIIYNKFIISNNHFKSIYFNFLSIDRIQFYIETAEKLNSFDSVLTSIIKREESNLEEKREEQTKRRQGK